MVFRGLVFIFCFFLLFSRPAGADAEEAGAPVPALDTETLRRRITGRPAAELAALNLGDTEVSLLAGGSWRGTAALGWGLSAGPLGLAALSGGAPPLFTQEADLTLSLWIREKWFVEAGFLDASAGGYAPNTYRAGYRGFPGEPVQYLGLGNTGLDFPAFPYLDLGGSAPSSFGVYGRFGGEDLRFHGLVRYDAAVREERVFVGGRERSYSFVPLDAPLRGRSFVLPQEGIPGTVTVYLEDREGSLRDGTGRRWRIARPGEYAASALHGLVELAAEPPGLAAVGYPGIGPGSVPGLGSYGTAGVPGAGFLGDAQDWFDPSRASLRLRDYPQPGGGSGEPGTLNINGVPVLVIYEGGTFSPFERQNRYQAPSSGSAGAELVNPSTGERASSWEVLPLEEALEGPPPPLYALPELRRDLYELVPAGRGNRLREAESRWPLGGPYPGLYLPGGGGAGAGDLGLRFTSYGAAGEFFLGAGAAPGSVEVFRGGLRDDNFSFDPGTGLVKLQSPSGEGELIRISYLKQGGEGRAGSLALGLGTVYDPEGPFSSELALGLRWNLAGESFSEDGASSPGTAALGARAAWDYGNLKAQIKAGLAFEQPDTTGLYRIAGMEGNEFTLGLPAEGSFLSPAPAAFGGGGSLGEDRRAPLVYRNYRETGLLGDSTLLSIGRDAPVLAGKSGPYPANDGSLGGRVLAAEFELGPGGTEWTGFQVPLGAEGALLEDARELEIPFRFYGMNGAAAAAGNFTLTVQFGVLTDEDAPGGENPDLVVEKRLFPPDPLDPQPLNPPGFGESPRIASPRFSPEERRRLQNARYMRVLVSLNGGAGAGNNLAGRVLLAPPILRGAAWRPLSLTPGGPAKDAGRVFALETLDAGGESLRDRYPGLSARLHGAGNSSQRVLELSWGDLDAGEAAGAGGRLRPPPLGDYRSLSFVVRGPLGAGLGNQAPFPGGTVPPEAVLRFILARGPEALEPGGGPDPFRGAEGQSALEAAIPLSALTPGRWSKVSLHYGGGERRVSVDGNTLPAAALRYNPAFFQSAARETGTGSVYAAVLLDPGGGAGGGPGGIPLGKILPGNFRVDELILEEPVPAYRINTGGSVEWTRPGALVNWGEAAILSDLSASAALESAARGDPFSGGPEGTASAAGRSRFEASLLGTRLSGNFALSLAGGQSRWEAGHGLSRAFGPLSLRESFSVQPREEGLSHRAEIGLAAPLPIRSRLSAGAAYEAGKLRQRWEGSLGTAPSLEPVAARLEAGTELTENSAGPASWLGNYAEAWAKSWGLLLPKAGAAAAARESRALVSLGLETRPLGAELALEGNAAFSAPRESTRAAAAARLEIPLRLAGLELRFRGERTYTRQIAFRGRDLRDDSRQWAGSIRDSRELWFALPLYSLFDPRLGAALDKAVDRYSPAEGRRQNRFEDHYALFLRTEARYDPLAFFLPNRFEARISRSLEGRLDTRQDLLSTGGFLGFSAVNLFGALGSAPLFRFYRSDEYSRGLEAAWTIPRDGERAWRIQETETMSFYGFSGAELGFTNTLTINSAPLKGGGGNWVESLAAAWTAPAPRSLLGALYDGFLGKAAGSPLKLSGPAAPERLRRETLELAVDHSRDYPRFSLALGHESILRIPGRLELSAFLKINGAQDTQTETLSFLANAGLSLRLNF
jgi:hypothetical protein